jgi:hypothetical protein
MSSKQDLEPTAQKSVEIDFDQGPADQKDQALASLEDRLAESEDRRKEERFLWVCTSVILLNITFLSTSENGWLAFGVLLLEFIVLITLARALGVDLVVEFMNKLINAISKGSE